MPALPAWRRCLSQKRMGCRPRPCSCVDLNLALSGCKTWVFIKILATRPPTHRALPGKGGGHEAAPRMQATPGGVPQSRSPWAELERVMGRRDPAYLQMWEGHSGRGNSLCKGNEPEDGAGWWVPRWVLWRRQWWGPQDGALAEGLRCMGGGPQKSTRSPAGAGGDNSRVPLEGLLRQPQGTSGGETGEAASWGRRFREA